MNIFIGVKWFIAVQCIWAASCLIDSEARAANGVVELEIKDHVTGKAVPCRIHFKNQEGKPIFAEGLPKWRDHFFFGGTTPAGFTAGGWSLLCETREG